MTAVSARRFRLPRPDSADGSMTLIEHLQELRVRMFKALVALVVGAIAAYIFFHPIFAVIRHPYCSLPASETLVKGCRFVFLAPFDAFTIRLKISLLVGAILTSPVWLYQLWAFITPALHRHERRWAVSFVVSAVGLFFAGCALAYYEMPRVLKFLLGVGGGSLVNLPTIDEYLGYLQGMLVVFGVSFELPLVLVMLNFAGVLSAARMRHWWRWSVLAIVVFAGAAAPSPDAVTMLVLAVPMVAFYLLALGVATLHDRRHPRDPYAGLDPDQTSPLPD
jgi:sec-independent protein translocase protein TatC